MLMCKFEKKQLIKDHSAYWLVSNPIAKYGIGGVLKFQLVVHNGNKTV